MKSKLEKNVPMASGKANHVLVEVEASSFEEERVEKEAPMFSQTGVCRMEEDMTMKSNYAKGFYPVVSMCTVTDKCNRDKIDRFSTLRANVLKKLLLLLLLV